jgi:hypothetical protein
MKHIVACAVAALGLAIGQAAAAEEPWTAMFDGDDLKGWRDNGEVPGCFTVDDGMIRVSGGRAHLFYVGPDGNASFTNFEFRARVMTTPESNSGIYFHTAFEPKGWPSKGYEAQVNNTHSDVKKTGGLYGIKDVLNDSPALDYEWFDYGIRVVGKKITITIDGHVTVEFTEPKDYTPPAAMPGRKLGSGTIALQGHDPKSTIYYKDLMIRRLP